MTCSPSLDHGELENFPVGTLPARAPEEQYISSIGALFLIDECGRTSLQSLRHVSHFRCASETFMNQCVFRHSARNDPFRLPMKALSVGLPGREKSSVKPFW